jgi:hypothetical protein
MHRKIATAAAILIGTLVVGAPAFALLAGPGDRPHLDATPPGGVTTTTSAPHVEPPHATLPAAGTSDPPPEVGATTPPPAGPASHPNVEPTSPPIRPAAGTEEHRDVPRLRLACAGGAFEGVAGARCEWSQSDSPAFARYVLWRQDPGRTDRRVVFQSTDRAMTAYLDKPLTPGGYHYGLLALSADNRTVGIAEPVEVTVPTPPAPPTTTAPRPLVMSLECHPVATPTAGPKVECHWSQIASERFAGYRLYREVPGTPAVVRFTTSDRNVTAAADDGLQPGTTYKYRIVAVDGDGRVIGSGGPVSVTIPAGSGDVPTP